MKTALTFICIVSALFLSSCSSQQITSSWINKEVKLDHPYKSICVIAMVPDRATKFAIEDKTAKLIETKGAKAVKSTSIFPQKIADEVISREELISKMNEAGCDGVLTITELDVKTESRYVPGSTPMPLPPFRFRYYNSYYSYYIYRNNQIYTPGYITEETTYFFETNFYDLVTENLLWSIQSNAFEPSGVDSWFQEYSGLLIKQLKKEGILAN